MHCTIHIVLDEGSLVVSLGLAGSGLIENQNIVLVVGRALCDGLLAGVGHQFLDLLRVLRRIGQIRENGSLLREYAALEIGLACADAAGLYQEGQAVIQAEVSPANGVVRRLAVMIHAQPGVLQLLKGVAAHIQSKVGYGRIVVQAGGGSGLNVVRIVHVARSVGPVEGELVGIHHHFRHEQTVGGVELGQLSSLQGHMVPVHVETVISRTAEQIGTVRIDPRHHNNVDIVQQSCGLRIGDQIGHYHQSALTSGGLVGMDLRLIPHSGLAVGVDQIGSFLQGGVLGDRRLGEDGQRDVEFVVGGGSGRIQVHVVTLGIHFFHVRYHLVLSGKLMGSVSAVEGGGGVLLVQSRILSGEVRIKNLIGPDAQHVVPGIHHIGVGGLAGLYGGLIAVAERIFVGAQLAAGDLYGHRARRNIFVGHVEDLQDIIVAVAGDVVAVSTGLVDSVAAVLIGQNLL